MNVKEIQTKYQEGFDFLDARKRRQVAQISLLNNLQRGDENIASTMLITLFNRIMSNLYDDKMQVKFVPSEEIDQKKVQSLNILAQNDYREMNKDKLDYDWNWDTLFYGRGYMETLRFDKVRKIMRPDVINPLVFGYDPYFADAQQWRYYWKWISKTKWELIKLIKDGTIDGVKDIKEIPSGMETYLWDYKIKKEQPKLVQSLSSDTHEEDVYQILEFYGYDDDGDKCVYWIDRNFAKVLMKQKLDLRDADNGKDSKWPIVVKEAFREPHSSVVFSVADLLDDKHRAKSVLLNLAFIAAKDKANPLYGYNPDQIKDITQLFNRQISQHIPMDNKDSMWPLNTANPMDPGLAQFLQMLSQEANDPIGTGMALQPVKKGKQSATETAIQQQLNDLAQSLQSKVMQFGEKDFWSDWYQRYRRYTKAGDEKIATITGVKGLTFEKIDLGDIHTKYPPGVLIFSAKEAEYKELVLRRDLMQMYPMFQESFGPDGMRNFNKYVFLPKFLQDPTMMDILIPDTLDEIKAKEENDSLKENEMVPVAETDNHEQHIPIHYMAKKTWATWIHISWHEELLAKQKQAQMQQEQQQAQDGKPQDKGKGDKAKVGADKQNPQKAAAPLMQETKPKDKVK